MNSVIDYVEFPAASIDEFNVTRDFYSQVFGWSYAMYGEDYADTGDSGTTSGINAEDPVGVVLPLVRVDDLDGMYESVKASGARS